MNEARLTTLEQVRAFLARRRAIRAHRRSAPSVRIQAAEEARAGVGPALPEAYDGLLAPATHADRQTLASREETDQSYRAPTHGLKRKFTAADVALLADTGSLHSTLSGPATRHLMARAWRVFGDARYERLATISVGHLYNLRKRA